MSISKKPLTVLGIVLATTMASTVFASGTINFTGEITDLACTVDSKSKNLNVDLGKVSSKSLSTRGEFSGFKGFTIKLNDCPAHTKVTVKFGGTRDKADRHLLALSQGTGVATNVGIALFEKDAVTQIRLFEDSKEVSITGTSESLDYIARYKATGKATAGKADGSAIYSIQYQ